MAWSGALFGGNSPQPQQNGSSTFGQLLNATLNDPPPHMHGHTTYIILLYICNLYIINSGILTRGSWYMQCLLHVQVNRSIGYNIISIMNLPPM